MSDDQERGATLPTLMKRSSPYSLRSSNQVTTGTLEDTLCGFEGDTVLGDVDLVLGWVQG